VRASPKAVFISSARAALPAPTGQQIICGNCAGDEDRAIRTMLTRAGTCENCGSRHYLLASTVGAARLLRIKQFTSEGGKQIL